MDRGMVSKANNAMLRERKAPDVVGTPKSQLRADGDGRDRLVLCRSTARGAKERAMLERQMVRLTEELAKVYASLWRRPTTGSGPVERRRRDG